MKSNASVHGFSMIEVLVSLFVLAVGLLGVAALQLSSITNNQEGYFRSQATALADDLVARMRGNRGIAEQAPVPAQQEQWFIDLYTAANCAAPPPVNCDVAQCTGLQMAAFDVGQVCALARQVLPGADVRVRRFNGAVAAVGVSWTASEERVDVGETDTAEYADPQCVQMGFAAGAYCVVLDVVPGTGG